ncbi:HAMP domain-containing sensor histidine kinase [Yoonia sp. GPGPB17]|uniref:sensor histidine kinase n=1 Tax=Yoonia sp. GPGPB17 TaxID=3026147 RepID=UPI0030C1E819
MRRSSMVRLSLLLSVIFALGMAATIFVALALGQNAVERRVDTTLEALASTALLESAKGESPSMILRGTDDLAGLPLPFQRAAARGGGTIELERNYLRSDIWRVLISEDSAGTPVMVAVSLEDSEQAQELLAGILWSTAGLVIAITLAIGSFAGVLAQRRLARVNKTLTQLAAGDLTARTGHARSRDDLDDIARQLDRTAAELESLVAQTRNLSASLAHDLRTPLARLRSRLEMLPEGDERSAALEEASHLSGVFDTIMRVARIEAGQGRDGFTEVPLGDLITELEEIFGPVVEDDGKVLKVALSAPATVQGDRQMLVQAMANLIQNALVHGGDEITLIGRSRSIGVADNGPGVDPSEYGEIIKPMVRLDSARSTEGTGLGLGLVRAVADRHLAHLSLAPQNAGGDKRGLRVMLNFADL